jgi:hypothetical protein
MIHLHSSDFPHNKSVPSQLKEIGDDFALHSVVGTKAVKLTT